MSKRLNNTTSTTVNNNLSNFDDLKLVTNLKSTDKVLVYGSSFVSGITDIENVSIAKKGKELTKFSSENSMFDRIYVSEDIQRISDVGMLKLTAMNAGMLVFFVDNEEHAQGLQEYFSQSYPWHEYWIFNTNVGPVFVTTAKGSPEWVH